MKIQDEKILEVVCNISQIEDYLVKSERIINIIDDKLNDDTFTIDSTRNLIENRKFLLDDLHNLQMEMKDSNTKLSQISRQMEKNQKILELLEKHAGSYYVAKNSNQIYEQWWHLVESDGK